MKTSHYTGTVTGSVTATLCRYIRVHNQHASAAATVDGVAINAGATAEYPMLDRGKYYDDIVIDGTASSLLVTAVTEMSGGGVS